MTTEQAAISIELQKEAIGLLMDIRDILAQRPAASSGAARGKTPPASDGTWRTFPWPLRMVDKKGNMEKYGELTLGDSLKTDFGRKNIRYWGQNYSVKPGKYEAESQQFRDALDGAMAFLDSAPADHTSAQPAPSRTPPPAKPASQTTDDDPNSIPF